MFRFATPAFLIVCATLSLRAEDVNSELERKLSAKCADLLIQKIEAKMKFKDDSQQVREVNEQLQSFEGLLDGIRRDAKDRLKAKLAEIDGEMQKFKGGRKEDIDFNRVQLIEQSRGAIAKKLLELELGFSFGGDDPQKNSKQMMQAQNSRFHLKLPNGAELEAEGPWLQNSPEAREVLETFNDPAKDGAISLRVMDPMEVDAIKDQLAKVAPNVKSEFSEKLRLLSLMSDDPVQLRRAAGVLKALRQNGPNPFGKGGGEFNLNMKGQNLDVEVQKRQPGKPGMDDVKKKKDVVDDKF